MVSPITRFWETNRSASVDIHYRTFMARNDDNSGGVNVKIKNIKMHRRRPFGEDYVSGYEYRSRSIIRTVDSKMASAWMFLFSFVLFWWTIVTPSPKVVPSIGKKFWNTVERLNRKEELCDAFACTGLFRIDRNQRNDVAGIVRLDVSFLSVLFTWKDSQRQMGNRCWAEMCLQDTRGTGPGKQDLEIKD